MSDRHDEAGWRTGTDGAAAFGPPGSTGYCSYARLDQYLRVIVWLLRKLYLLVLAMLGIDLQKRSMATVSEENAAARGFRRLSAIFLPPQSNNNRCQRCKEVVYQQERMGPVHDVIFHKVLLPVPSVRPVPDLKNYWSNQVKGDDPEIYCNTHVPRIGGSGMSHEALGIRQAMQAQLDISSAAAARVAKIRHPDVAPSVDGEAMAIRSALSAQKTSQYGRQLHTSNIDAEALHIKGAMDAQRLQRRYQRKLDKHHFPPHIVSTVHA
ncbi:hypothetical protein C0Q70_16329 [Pomacea canaliculata]|uniref:Uncharacterized protein n=1 Tax=Pomacea canaliculata TaxID=400727 RepID=A0A2T7NPG9_POMCA|nr:hypothetical protein C0Q70_16329 [Pomacea canaliculata]